MFIHVPFYSVVPISSFFLPLHTDVINKNYSEYEAKEVWQKYQHVTKFMGVAVDGSKDNCIANLKLAGLTADNTGNADSHKALR